MADTSWSGLICTAAALTVVMMPYPLLANDGLGRLIALRGVTPLVHVTLVQGTSGRLRHFARIVPPLRHYP
jgi:hypothetical protein